MGGPGSGRRRKPTEFLKLHGTYREDRHGGRSDAELAIGKPEKPRGLPKRAGRLWDHLIKSIHPAVLAAVDSAPLEGMCRWWDVYQDSLKSGDMRTASVAWGHFQNMATKFGMTPTDRTKLKLPAEDTRAKDPIEEMLG